MSLQELESVVLPPQKPLESGTLKLWTSFEKTLGISLPKDYRDMVFAYGTGQMANFINIFNPFSKLEYANFALSVKRITDVLQTLKIIWQQKFPYDIFPDNPGLLPWGSDENGNWFYWLTEGSPDDWPVIIGSGREPHWQQIDLSMTTFLAKALNRKIKCDLWPETFPNLKNSKHSSFRPIRE